jgi:fumarylacetoacetate (FAA) hydrolase
VHLVTYLGPREVPEAGVLLGEDEVVPAGAALDEAGVDLGVDPVGVVDLLEAWDEARPALEEAPEASASPLEEIRLLAPLPWPMTLRDFYAFEEHVSRANKRRGEEVPDAWYEIPVFYFSNPMTVVGPGEPVLPPRETEMLDFELELAWTLREPVRDPTPEEAAEAVGGVTIMNDWSARDLQAQEMQVGLGPSKGKDFATSLGPSLVTPDEFEGREAGNAWDLEMRATINGEERSRGNLADVHWSLGEMTAHAAADVTVHPGEVLATGTVGTGSLLDLGAEPGEFLEPGDEVALEVEGVGLLENTVVDPTEIEER